MANNKPQQWKGAKYLILWSTTDSTVFYLNYDHSKAQTTTYCNRDDAEGYMNDSWTQIKNKMIEQSLLMTEHIQWIYNQIEDGIIS